MPGRVVFTGIGAITPLGRNAVTTNKALCEGKSGVRLITSFDTAEFRTKIAAEVDFDPLDHFDKRDARHIDRLAQFGIVAGLEAAEQARLSFVPKHVRVRMCPLVGAGVVGFHTAEREIVALNAKGPHGVNPFAIIMFQPDAIVGWLARLLDMHGPSYTVNSACASGHDAVVLAYEKILADRGDIFVTGGTGAEVTPFGVATFGRAGALSTRNDDPEGASRPFSQGRDGFVLGEGAVILVVESLEMALWRGVPILGEIAGCGQYTDTYHPTQPDPTGNPAVAAMLEALEDAHMRPGEVDLISAHGTSTPYNDKMEALAIQKVFRDEGADPLVNATKSMAGHLIAGAGPLGILAALHAIETGWVHPTLNLSVPDEGCELNHVTGAAIERKVDVAMINAFGFQGHNTSIIVKRFVL